MTRVGVKALKDGLSGYLRRARAGERILVTDRGKPLALLTSLEETGDEAEAWSLVERGLANWNGGKPKGLSHAPKPRGKSTAEMVLEDRR